ncbi:hypothetical protein SCHPADRAFT_926855 [Schizopora paradoxa]|uniref:Uncharacterized protein n=1 Tax=Schizopora paradoxa TaxID=27342 RepID=A0A0H2RWJ2_9AGAM|nr:hypothetical protein SCHPADRAFT_926855 [Schizopora paradoxa]
MPFPQPGESAADLWLERSNFAGVVLSGVFYGQSLSEEVCLHLAVFSVSTYFVIKAPATGKISWTFLSLLIGFIIVGTLQVASAARFGELVWIDNRGYTGGPIAWYHSHYNDPSNILGLGTFIFGNFLADGVLLYRLFVIWDRNYFVMIIPVMAYLASTALSVVAVFQAAQPNSARWSHSTVVFELPYWALTTGLNVLITLVLAFRLIRMRRAVVETLGEVHAKLYTSVIAMIVESAVIYAAVGLICIITFAVGSNILNFVEPILGQILCICPELIILRVTYGRAWTRNMTENNSARRVLVRPMSVMPGKQTTLSVPAVASTSDGSFESFDF